MTTTITEYSKTEAALAELREKYGRTYDVSTAAGMKEARAARAEVKRYRVDLEAKRVEIKAPALEHCRLIDAEAKRITAALLEIERPIDNAIQAEEKRKADEKARVETEARARAKAASELRMRIQSAVMWAVGKSELAVLECVAGLAALQVPEDEHAEETMAALKTAHEQLEHIRRQAREQAERDARAAADRAEAERLRAEAAAVKAQAEAEAKRARDESERAARAERDRLDAEARAAREEADRIAAAERAAEQKRLAVERAEIERIQEAARQRRREEEERNVRRMSARETLAMFAQEHADEPEFRDVVAAIGRYFAMSAHIEIEAQP